MLSGDNGILSRATDAKTRTEKAQIIENAQTDILGQQADNKGANITKGQLVTILNTYFKPTAETAIPDEVSSESGHDIVLTTIDEKYKINLSQIFTGSFEIEQAKWSYSHDTQTVTNGTLTLNIGDYVNDTETNVEGFDGKWRVLGVEDGQLLLVTATYYASFEANTDEGITKVQIGPAVFGLQLGNVDGWNNGVTRLNSIGAIYNNDKLEKGRSIKIEDINKITGYNPNNIGVNDPSQTGTGIPFGNGSIAQYKNKVTYTLENGKVYYQGTNAITTKTESSETRFKPLGETDNITEPYIVNESTAYTYYPTTLTTTQDNTASVGIATDSAAYDMLFKTPYSPYWLASTCVYTWTGNVIWEFFYVPSGIVSLTNVWDSSNGSSGGPYGVRPVEFLKSNITPTFVSKDDTTNISTYEI